MPPSGVNDLTDLTIAESCGMALICLAIDITGCGVGLCVGDE
jgi:hypothetical protein